MHPVCCVKSRYSGCERRFLRHRSRRGDLRWRAERELWLQHRFGKEIIQKINHNQPNRQTKRLLFLSVQPVVFYVRGNNLTRRSAGVPPPRSPSQTPTRWSTTTWSSARAATAPSTTAGAPASSKATTRPATAKVAPRTACRTPTWEGSPPRGKPTCVQPSHSFVCQINRQSTYPLSMSLYVCRWVDYTCGWSAFLLVICNFVLEIVD